jgi:AmmeMemoRadiSam system protein A
MNGEAGRHGSLAPHEREWLLDLARRSVTGGLAGAVVNDLDPATVPASLRVPGAAFVTLRRDGRLLGCIGSITPYRPLADDVAAHAYDAAFRDPRLPAVTSDDAALMTVEISVLGPLERLGVRSRQELAAMLRPGVDGLWINSREGRATFLPSVWDQIDGVDDFLDHLWMKAGIPHRRWPDDLEVDRYTVEEFDDGPTSGAPPRRSSR